jgi:hypothetical protein
MDFRNWSFSTYQRCLRDVGLYFNSGRIGAPH